ncbi:type II secretion system protein [Natronospora cellulosivora (SeqCode)]
MNLLSRAKEKKGFTLIEIMLSLVILATISIVISLYFVNGMNNLRVSMERQNAINSVSSTMNKNIMQNINSIEDEIEILFNNNGSEISLKASGKIFEELETFNNEDGISTISLSYFKAVIVE